MARLNGGRRRGLAVVEAALLLPFLLALTLGLLEFGWAFLKIQQVNSAAREGARVAARAGSTNTQVETAVEAVMDQAGMGIAGSSYALTKFPTNVQDAAVQSQVRITVTVDYEDNIDLIGGFIPVPDSISGEYYMMKEGG